jgi:hypothetical protein
MGSDLDTGARRHRDRSTGPRWSVVAIAVGVVAALCVAFVRNDLLRVQYGLARALNETRQLERDRKISLAQVRALRDPARLVKLAADRGFVRPARLVDLPAAPPTPAGGMRR